MNPDETTDKRPEEEERIRKVYAKDLKAGEAVHTVFRVAKKERHASRTGKPFLSFSLQDRTGEVDGRVFEAVEAAEKAFVDGDYLLVKGKVGVFHGKNQVVLDSLERLDPTPLDPKEFTPPAPPRDAPGLPARSEAPPEAREARRAARARVLRLLDDPQILDGLTALFRHIDGWADERLGGSAPAVGEPRKPRPSKGPKVEHRPEAKPSTPAEAREQKDAKEPREPKKPARDPSLPGAFAFKPFAAVAQEVSAPPEPAAPAAPAPPAADAPPAEAPKAVPEKAPEQVP